MKNKLLLILLLIQSACSAADIVIENCTVPHVRNHMLIYHAADGRIIFGGDESVSKTPVQAASYDGFVRLPEQNNYTIEQDGPDCIIRSSGMAAPTAAPPAGGAARPFDL